MLLVTHLFVFGLFFSCISIHFIDVLVVRCCFEILYKKQQKRCNYYCMAT